MRDPTLMIKGADPTQVKTLIKNDLYTIQAYKDEWVSFSIAGTDHYETAYIDANHAWEMIDKIKDWLLKGELRYEASLYQIGTSHSDYVRIDAHSTDSESIKWFNEFVSDRIAVVMRDDTKSHV